MPRRPIPISRVEAAAKKCCDKATVTRACQGALVAAVLPGGDLDSGHPDFIAWQPQAAKRRIQATSSAAPSDAEIDSELTRLSRQFTSQRELGLHLRNRKVLAEAMRLESRNERDSGRLISRAGVETFVFGYLERLSLNLLRNFPESVLPQLSSLIKSGGTREEQLKVIRDRVSGELKSAKEAIVKILAGDACKAGDNPAPPKDEMEPNHG